MTEKKARYAHFSNAGIKDLGNIVDLRVYQYFKANLKIK